MKTVIFACVHNAGRSQMAAAFFRALCAPHLVRALSAGTEPSETVDLVVVAAMRELGMDLSGQKPRLLTPELLAEADLVVTMGCGERCPASQKARREDWAISDPRGQPIEVVRKIRDDVRKRVWKLLAKEGWYRLQPASALRLPGQRLAVT